MSPSTLGTKVTDSKMDDMTKLIKNLSAKFSRLEMENRKQNNLFQDNDNKNPNQIRRPFNPRFYLETGGITKIRKYNLPFKVI